MRIIFPSFDTLLIFFHVRIPDEQSLGLLVPQSRPHIAQWLIHQMKFSARYCENFEIYNFSRRIIRKMLFVVTHCKYKPMQVYFVQFYCICPGTEPSSVILRKQNNKKNGNYIAKSRWIKKGWCNNKLILYICYFQPDSKYVQLRPPKLILLAYILSKKWKYPLSL